MSWRNSLPVHDAANLFPLLPEAELEQLGSDIKMRGLTSPIAIQVERGSAILVDGRNRLDALELVGLRVSLVKTNTGSWRLVAKENLTGEWDEFNLNRQIGATVTVVTCDPVEYITSVNIHRRHLTTETKRDLIAKLLKEKPERSDRATAALVKVDHKTVAAVRRKEEDVGSIPHVEKRVDTKGRQQPATKESSRPYPFNLIGPNGEKPEVIPEGWLWSEKKQTLYRKPNPPRATPTEVRTALLTDAKVTKPKSEPDVVTAPSTAPDEDDIEDDIEQPKPRANAKPRTKIAQARLDGFFNMARGLLFMLEGLEEDKPDAITLIAREIADNPDRRQMAEGLRDRLNRLLATAKTKTAVETATDQKPSGAALEWKTTPTHLAGHCVHESTTDVLAFKITPADSGDGFSHYAVQVKPINADWSEGKIVGRAKALDLAKEIARKKHADQAQAEAVG